MQLSPPSKGNFNLLKTLRLKIQALPINVHDKYIEGDQGQSDQGELNHWAQLQYKMDDLKPDVKAHTPNQTS